MGRTNQKKLGSPVLPPVLFPGKTSTERRHLAALKADGHIRLVGPRLYVSVPDDQVEATLRQSWSSIVERLFPNALITHRTALDFTPTRDGEVFITSNRNREVRYPGLVLRFIRGPKPLADDPKFLTIRCSSLPRALLENLSTHKATRSRVVSAEQLEARVEQILHAGGETEVNKIRDRARQIAEEFGWNAELKRLDTLVGTLLGTRRGRVKSAIGRARAVGEPFDAACVERLQLLFAELRGPIGGVVDSFSAPDHIKNKAFFESYFSNYIEGTTFQVEEAEAIVFDKKIPPARPKDAHDVLGTFEIVSDVGEMRRTAESFDDFIEIIRKRHAKMMARRPEAAPGEFKTEINRAGETVFVHPEYVSGTLRKGWDLSRDLTAGLPRAIFIAFLVSDVHPFVDGNGRTSRIMSSSELMSVGQSTIIIPTVFRDDYLGAQRALTRRHRPQPLVQALVRAQKFSSFEFAPYPATLAELIRRNWFREPDEARIID
jgi:hypothetical protein